MHSKCRRVVVALLPLVTLWVLGFWALPASGGGPAVPQLLPPGDQSAQASSSIQITLSWTDTNTRESGYLVERSLSPSGDFVQIKSLTTNARSFTDSSLASSTTYHYRVRAFQKVSRDAPRYSDYAIASATTLNDTQTPSAPSVLKAAATSASSVKLTWKAAKDFGGSGLKGYMIYRDGAFLILIPPQDTYAVDSGLSPSAKHHYQVSAIDLAGNESLKSGSVIASTPSS